MKARRFLLAAVLSVVGCAFAVAGCGEKADDGHQHDYEWEITTPATCEHEGERKGTCKVCGNETTEKLDRAPHTLDGTPTVKEPSTCIAKGVGTVICSVCGTEQTVELDYAPHTLTHHEAVAGDCKTDGTIEYWDCSVCKNNFSDKDGTIDVTSLVIPKESYPHDYDERGVCKVCGAHDPNVTEHICTPVKVDGVEADCKTPGVVEHYKCSDPTCGKLYKDAQGKEPMKEEDTVIPVSNDHNPSANAIHKDAAASNSCLNCGRKESWDCKVCGRHFADPELTKELFDVGADGVCGENTLQTPKSDVHVDASGKAAWAAHAKADPTCTTPGWSEDVYVCDTCGLIFRNDEFDTSTNKAKINKETGEPYAPLDREKTVLPIDPAKHSTPEKHTKSNENPDRCGGDNVTWKEDCWECTYCKKLFSDEAMTQEVYKKEVANFGKHSDMEEIEESNSTCTEHGHPHCWKCSSCGEYFDVEDPEPSTDPLPQSEYERELLPHSFTDYGYNSQGHWHICDECGEVEKDEYGNTKIEDHEYEDDATDCFCGYDKTNTLAQYFTFDDGAGDTATITGFEVQDGKVLFEESTETILTLPDVDKLGRPVTAIADNALSSSAHTNYSGIYKNKITKIVIPASITKIGASAFKVQGGMGGTYGDTPIIGSNVKEIEFESSTATVEIGAAAFRYHVSMEKITLPKHLKEFSSQMLMDCTALTTIVMPEKIEGEGTHELKETFRNCKSLEKLDLWCLRGKSYSLGQYAVQSCSSLTDIYLPKTLTKLSTYCLGRCTSLTKIHYEGSSQEWTAIEKDTTSQWNYLSTGIQDQNTYLDAGYTHDNNN